MGARDSGLGALRLLAGRGPPFGLCECGLVGVPFHAWNAARVRAKSRSVRGNRPLPSVPEGLYRQQHQYAVHIQPIRALITDTTAAANTAS